MKVIIITYNRHYELQRLLNEVKHYDYHVIDDGSDAIPLVEKTRLTRLPHFGKEGFWRVYNFALAIAKASKHDDYIILPDDVYNVEFNRIKHYHELLKDKRYFINAINDGRDRCWSMPQFKAQNIEGLKHTGFFDCGGLTNRNTIESFYLNPVLDSWFKSVGSSGVGAQITKRMNIDKVPMYTPIKSLAYHGDHESKMHPEERSINPLISK